jgi:hypothetical protein
MRRIALSLLLCLGLPAAVPADQRVATRMRNVVFRVGDGVEVRVIDLRGIC